MSYKYAFDLYPRDDPKDGTRVLRFSSLQEASYMGQANGTGSGKIVLRGTSTDAASIDPAGMQYVRVVRIDTSTADATTLSDFDELVVGGFFLETGDFEALTENSTKKLTFTGAGVLSYLDRAVMWSHTYRTGGDDPFDDIWRLSVQGPADGSDNKLGSMFYRAVVECMSYGDGTDGGPFDDDRAATAIPALTADFDYDSDSDGNAWGVDLVEFTANVGESLLSVAQRLMQAGLYVQLDPDTFELHAWDAEDHGRDATGAAWGTDVVRFQSPTDGTIVTGNIKSDAKRAIQAKIQRTALLVGGNDKYALSTRTDDVLWEGLFSVEATDDTSTTALGAVGDVQLNAREDAGDTIRLRGKLDDDADNGKYVPFETIKLDDSVTIHTGTGQWDWNEATAPVAALTISLRPGGDWDYWVDLGSTFTDQQSRQFKAPGSVRTGGPTLRLCDPETSGCTDLTDGAEIDTFAEHNTTGHWNSNANFGDFTSDDDNQPPVVGDWMVGYSGVLTASNNFMYYAFTGTFTAGKQYTFKFWVKSDKSEDMTAYFGATDTISVSLPSVFTEDSVTLTITPDGEWHQYQTDWTPETTIVADGSNATAVNVRWGLDSTGSADGYVFVDGGTLCVDTSANPLSGTGNTAARCGHKHHALSESAPTADDDGDAGYPTTTLWTVVDDLDAPTSITATYVSLDDAAGAAVWVELSSGGGSYTDEDAQDAVGAMVADTTTIDFTYTDATPELKADVIPSGIKLDDLGTPDDNTDLNASTSKHGLLPKLGGGTTNFLRADGTWAAPPSGGSVDAEDVAVADTAGNFTGTDVEAVLAELQDNIDAVSGGGGGSGSSPFYLDTIDLDSTYGDDFDGSSLDAKWSLLGIDADTYEIANGCLTVHRRGVITTGGEGFYQTPATMPDYLELIWAGSYTGDTSTGGSPQAGPFMVTSAGAGMGACINPQTDRFRLTPLSSGAPSGTSAELTRTKVGSAIGMGTKHWIKLIRIVADGATLFLAQLSLDGSSWQEFLFLSDATAVTRIGMGRFVGVVSETFSTDRCNPIALTLGNNLCHTPSSGTLTAAASSTFSGFSAADAFDGSHTSDWASNGYAAGQWISGTWSVAQTGNLILLRGRNNASDQWGYGYVEFSDGSKVGFGWMGHTGNTNNAMVIRLPSAKTTTLLKVVSVSGGNGNPGFVSIEFYNAS